MKEMDDIIENLVRVTSEILIYKANKAMGKKSDTVDDNYVPALQDELLKLAKPLIQSYGVTKSLSAQSAADVTKLLSKGKIDINEAKELLELITKKQELAIYEKINR